MRNMTTKAWYRLDNAAKIFPPTSNRSETWVFRLSCELNEEVQPKELQEALDRTMTEMKNFAYVLKRGLFWYYLEKSDWRAKVEREEESVCSTSYLDKGGLLFEVVYYRKRINLEVYHALTDGMGARQFLQTLVINYLKLIHPQKMKKVRGGNDDKSETQKMADSFHKYYDQQNLLPSLGVLVEQKQAVYQIRGARETEWRLKVVEGKMAVDELLQKAREYQTTLTGLVVALLLRAIYAEMSVRERRKDIVITVPVDLRNFFESESARNFFSLINIKYNFGRQGETLEEVIAGVKKCFAEQLNREYLQTRLNKLLSLEENWLVRLVPLRLKNLGIALGYRKVAREFTAAVSNLGKISMPKETEEYIKLWSAMSSTDKLQICFCSSAKLVTISFTSPLISTDIARHFWAELRKMGVAADIVTNAEQDGGKTFPMVALVRQKHSLLWRLLQLGSVAIVIVSLMINWMLPESGLWSALVAAGVACAWMVLLVAIYKRRHILKNLAYQVTMVSGLAVVWDIGTGWHGWSVNFVMPIAFICAMVVTAILARILKLPIATYLMYSCWLIIYGLVPAGFVLSGLSTIIYPALICVTVSLLLLATLLIFEGKNMWEELRRRLHW